PRGVVEADPPRGRCVLHGRGRAARGAAVERVGEGGGGARADPAGPGDDDGGAPRRAGAGVAARARPRGRGASRAGFEPLPISPCRAYRQGLFPPPADAAAPRQTPPPAFVPLRALAWARPSRDPRGEAWHRRLMASIRRPWSRSRSTTTRSTSTRS